MPWLLTVLALACTIIRMTAAVAAVEAPVIAAPQATTTTTNGSLFSSQFLRDPFSQKNRPQLRRLLIGAGSLTGAAALILLLQRGGRTPETHANTIARPSTPEDPKPESPAPVNAPKPQPSTTPKKMPAKPIDKAMETLVNAITVGAEEIKMALELKCMPQKDKITLEQRLREEIAAADQEIARLKMTVQQESIGLQDSYHELNALLRSSEVNDLKKAIDLLHTQKAGSVDFNHYLEAIISHKQALKKINALYAPEGNAIRRAMVDAEKALDACTRPAVKLFDTEYPKHKEAIENTDAFRALTSDEARFNHQTAQLATRNPAFKKADVRARKAMKMYDELHMQELQYQQSCLAAEPRSPGQASELSRIQAEMDELRSRQTESRTDIGA